jgi:1-acyl-sn-glycerol-3-phosphate acyltransferase
MNLPYQFTWGIGRALLRFFYGYECAGTEHMPKKGSVLIASNHASFIDPPAIGCALNRDIHYFARKSLFKGVMEWYLPRVNTIPVERGASDVKAMKSVFKVLEDGEGILIFPEGTRTSDGNLLPVKKGVGMLACRGNSPVLPARIFGSFEAYGREQKVPRINGSVQVCFGPLLQPHDYDPGPECKDRYMKAAEIITAAIAKIEKPKWQCI